MARTFDGTDDVLTDGDADYDPDITFTIWYRYNSASWADVWQTIIAKRQAASNPTNYLANIRGGATNLFQWGFNIAGVFSLLTTSASANLPRQAWTQLTCQLHQNGTGVDSAIYVNGTSVTSTTHTNKDLTSSLNNTNTTLGAYTSGTLIEEYTGDMAYCTLYSSQLGANQIAALGRGVNPFVFETKGQLWPIEVNDSTEPDYMAQAKKLTPTGTTKTVGNPPVEMLENNL